VKQDDELALKVTKEIVIKYIETGLLSLGSFDEVFKKIHRTVKDSLQGSSGQKKSPE
jgi:hypothetical protein